jgi:hypothetical protein
MSPPCNVCSLRSTKPTRARSSSWPSGPWRVSWPCTSLKPYARNVPSARRSGPAVPRVGRSYGVKAASSVRSCAAVDRSVGGGGWAGAPRDVRAPLWPHGMQNWVGARIRGPVLSSSLWAVRWPCVPLATAAMVLRW